MATEQSFRVLDKTNQQPAIEVNVSTAACANLPNDINQQKLDDYEQVDLNGLPTYQEVLEQKKNQHYVFNMNNNGENVNDTVIPNSNNEFNNNNSLDVGSDFVFLTAFFCSFLFNWIGFMASICFLPSIAGKYGALSGFGLSIIKWATIVRYQEWTLGTNDYQQKLFFWIFVALGFYLFIRGLLTYISIKHNQNAFVRSNFQRFLILNH